MTRHVLIVAADSHMDPGLLVKAIRDAVRADVRSIEVLVPAVMPSALPITACPPRVAARLNALREAAGGALRTERMAGRVQIALCRNVPALLRACEPADTLVIVGRAGWQARRTARTVAADLVFVPTGARRTLRGRREPVAHARPLTGRGS
jgi:hypothetical protein